jgi:putative inorganic carbon (HCO3(-)) transporter
MLTNNLSSKRGTMVPGKKPPHWLGWLELVVMGVLAPWFLVPSLGFHPWLMAVPLVFWGVRLFVTHRLTQPSPLSIPITGMTLMLGISMLATFSPSLSLPKVVGIYFGIILYFVIINNLSWNLAVHFLLPAILVAGFTIAVLSLFGMEWTESKLPIVGPVLKDISQQIPRLITNLPRTREGISTNQLGGTLVLFIPLQTTYLIYAIRTVREKIWAWMRVLSSGVGLSLTLVVLLLTQSRGAIASAFIVLSALSIFYLRRRWWAMAVLLLLAFAVAGVLIFSPETSQTFISERFVENELLLSARPIIWSSACRIIQDYSLTGIGLDTFPSVLAARYPNFLIPAEQALMITHAHNLYLQTALDLGVPGLIAFLALLAIVTWMLVITVKKTASPLVQNVAVGLLLGLGAQLIYGWIDCIALGQKPSIFFWVYLALSTLIYQHTTGKPVHPPIQ